MYIFYLYLKPLNPCFCITDINECAEETHNCEQQCNNTISSFRCSCHAGYELMNDGFSCKRKRFTILCLTKRNHKLAAK